MLLRKINDNADAYEVIHNPFPVSLCLKTRKKVDINKGDIGYKILL